MSTGNAPFLGSPKYVWAGLSTDAKPRDAFVGQEVVETDTGNVFEWTGSMWASKAFKGALNVHEVDAHHHVVNQLAHRRTGAATTLTGAVSSGDTSIVVADGSSFPNGSELIITNGVFESTFPVVTSGGGTNTLTLDRPLDNEYSVGDAVELIATDLAVTGSLGSPVVYAIEPPAGEVWNVMRLIFSMTHPSAADDSMFGSLAALTNGVALRANVNGTLNTFTVWKSNQDIIADMYDVTYSDKAGGGLFGTRGRGSFYRVGVSIRLDGDAGDHVEVLIQDDLSGLDYFGLNFQGYVDSA